MGLFDGIEKLITEHGSATILKERIALAADKYAALEEKAAAAEAVVAALQKENASLKARLAPGGHLGHVCDHCASENLTRTGTRPHPTFGRVGTKEAVYRCVTCGKESTFELRL